MGPSLPTYFVSAFLIIPLAYPKELGLCQAPLPDLMFPRLETLPLSFDSFPQHRLRVSV